MILPSDLWDEIRGDVSSLGWRDPLLVIVASICIFVSMGMQNIFSSVKYINMVWAPFDPAHLRFYAYVHWFLNYFVFYLLVPLLFVCVFYRCRLSFFGLGTGDLRKYLPLYGILLLFMIPVTTAPIASGTGFPR